MPWRPADLFHLVLLLVLLVCVLEEKKKITTGTGQCVSVNITNKNSTDQIGPPKPLQCTEHEKDYHSQTLIGKL